MPGRAVLATGEGGNETNDMKRYVQFSTEPNKVKDPCAGGRHAVILRALAQNGFTVTRRGAFGRFIVRSVRSGRAA